ncbi:MAG: hypothetical protein UW44_C0003G0010 [Candidatus Collierbacteria bacterium GW2011_GWB2_44_22]|uniref:Glycosyltransferase RgtA/B/C/D-like domain-containing protein n=1 Tax=Candidatus Collierbacteria bacterium GW2011_GWB2_44_22 TaxID=1618387 RepID=A0A0G1K787_9BACT|nr:MAG: hypothetical protein UW31_C0001G0066 [Candidatus Collierbacteria bacterium GW2011_GWA2_44_13]KKT52167.1 MAG: hypothetical protein UW44_C0003G0010 [Candidatus Collierbacteria bacterium GW2011_GWB2_44_22]KKT62331.1 MAG: hypothetical protein UW56_C0008G0010 [Candidatus Collierbacteria bacterium GW2011_GWD1_44_27]KKT65878.1 MAG: hypothetical protein UW58_C0017G0010 [Candidatus Collierbacteria bacterium GW2011_GWC2_44_30]
MLRKFIFFFLLLLLCFTGKARAFKAETYVSFANPVRGSEGWGNPKQTPLDLPIYQYRESTSSAYPITWLLRYDAVKDATMSAFFSGLIETDKNQSLGSFLEITPRLTEAANVIHPGGISLFNANRIFLSGYQIEDRKKLIDTYMSAFFVRFGFYPKSVSAWHLDSYSLQYLQSKYSVLTAMNCDDQYNTDSYRLWGGYLGSPYFPDKNNSLVPADSFDNRINLAMVRWAQRDLFNFYGSNNASLYSVQVNDYLTLGQDTKYFEKLLAMYDQKGVNDFTYVNVGLENDYDLSLYKNEIKHVYKSLKDNNDRFNFHPISLSDFGDWFKARYPESSPAYYYQTGDPTGVNSGEVFWYQSPFYRLGLKSENGNTYIIDFRVFNREIYEDYFATPNHDLELFHEVPAVIDSVKFPGTEVALDIDLQKADLVRSKQWDYWQTSLWQDGKLLTLQPDKIVFSNFTAPLVASKDITPIVTKSGVIWKFTPHTPFKNTTHLTWLFWLLIVLILVILAKAGIHPRSGPPKLPRYLILGVSIALLAGLTVFRNGLLYPFGMGFWGPNGHDAIFHLSVIEKFAGSPFSFSHPQIAGEKIANYHFIFDFLSGITVKLLGISSIDLYFRIFPIFAGLAIVLLLDKLLKSWGYSRSERFLSLLLVFLAGSFGFIPKIFTGQDIFAGESAFWSNQSVSIFLNPPYALSIIILLLFLNKLNGEPRTNNSELITLSLLGGLLAQTKIYAFILLLGALLFSKRYKLFIGVLIVGVLVSFPFTTFGGHSPFIFSPFWFPRSLFASFDRFYWPRLVEAWQAYEASGNFIKLSLINLFAMIVFLVGNLGIRIFGLLNLCRTNPISESEKIVRWIIAFGLLLPLLFVQNINPWNTIQFMYYALFFLGIFTAKAISSLISTPRVILADTGIHPDTTSSLRGASSRRGNLYRFFIIFIVLLLAVASSVGTLKDYIGYFSASRISFTELRALDKLRDQPKGIVLSPYFSEVKSSSVSTPKPLYSYVSTAYISGLSGQPEFLSDTINLDITGFDYVGRARDIQRFYNTEDKEWGITFLKSNAIKYVYETRLQKLKLAPADLHLEKIFDSGEINVYKFN